MIRVQDQVYELIEENKDGFIQETFKERYSDILTKFDYIVGDWGYGQLRLKGFYEDTNRKAPFDSRISFLDEYIMEYCNFGCPYFLLKKVKQATRIDDVEAAELIDQDEQPRVEKGEEKPARNKDGKRRDKRRSRSRRGKPKESKEQKETKEKQPMHTE